MTDPFQNFNWLSDDGIFLPMINDRNRNKFYADAIKASAPGKVVVDIGTGTGILSILSARAGAKKVYAVEQDPGRAEFARQMFQRLNLTNVIEVVNANFLDTEISGDIYVSETINVQIFGEDILSIADHAQKHGGTFIPGKFEITARVFRDHAIFMLDQNDYESVECDIGIDIDPAYKDQIDQDFVKRHDVDNIRYRANHLRNLFQLLPRIPEIKLDQVYETPVLTVDLNQPIDIDKIRLTIPASVINDIRDPFHVVLFWKAKYQDCVMDCQDVYFGNVSKHINLDRKDESLDIETWYNPEKKNWYFKF